MIVDWLVQILDKTCQHSAESDAHYCALLCMFDCRVKLARCGASATQNLAVGVSGLIEHPLLLTRLRGFTYQIEFMRIATLESSGLERTGEQRGHAREVRYAETCRR